MNKKAFTLVETLMGITLISVVFTAVLGLVLGTLMAAQKNIHMVQAKAYAQEGLEVMRYIRDSNWLQNYAWAGTPNKAVGNAYFDPQYESEYTLYLKEGDCPPCWTFSSEAADGKVSNDQGFEFLRTIHVLAVKDEKEAVEVTAILEWSEKGIPTQLKLSTFLTDWK